MFHKYQAHIYPITCPFIVLLIKQIFFSKVAIIGAEMSLWIVALFFGVVISCCLLLVPKIQWKIQPRVVGILSSLLPLAIFVGISGHISNLHGVHHQFYS